MHEVDQTLSNQIHRHKSISMTIFTTSKIILNIKSIIQVKTYWYVNLLSNEWIAFSHQLFG